MRRALAVVCLGVFPVCAGDEKVDTVYDPCSPLTLVVDDDVSEAALDGIEGAIAAWNEVLPTRIVIGSGPKARDALPIHFESGEPFYRGIYWDAIGEIAIAADRLAPEDYGLAIAHELGHAFGLLHVENAERPSVMNVGNLEVPPTAEDAAAVRARWPSCGTALAGGAR